MKKLIGKLHLWLGLTSGLLVFIIAITGSIYAFQEEISNLTQPYRYSEKQNKEYLLPSEIVSIAEKELPGKHIHAVMYPGEGKSAKVIFYSEEEEYYYFVYVNPYSGKVLSVSDENSGFFRFILDGHFYLWLPAEIGQPIVAWVTLIFFAMVVSGIILWWPRNKNNKRQKFSIRWNARWRRKNYDLHSVIGFYVSWVAIIFIITGLVWGFQWFNKGYYYLISGGNEFIEYENPISEYKKSDENNLPSIDRVWIKLMKEYNNSVAIEVHTPEDSLSTIAVNINPDPSTYWQTDYRYYDQYSLKELSVKHMWGRFEDSSTADVLMKMNYDIHVGSILGITGKILACLFSLLIASLPITGFLLWRGRVNKSKDILI